MLAFHRTFILPELGQGTGSASWVQRPLVRKEAGRPYSDTCASAINRQVIMVDLSRAADVFGRWRYGLRCKALGAAVAEVWWALARSQLHSKQATGNTAQRASGSHVGLIGARSRPQCCARRWPRGSVLLAPHSRRRAAPVCHVGSLDLFPSRRQNRGNGCAAMTGRRIVSISLPQFCDGTWRDVRAQSTPAG